MNLSILPTLFMTLLLSPTRAVEASPTIPYLRMWDKPNLTGDEVIKNFKFGHCENWTPAIGVYVQSAAASNHDIVCEVFDSSDDCTTDYHAFNTTVKNVQREGIPTFWRIFRCYDTFDPPAQDEETQGAESRTSMANAASGHSSTGINELVNPVEHIRAVTEVPATGHDGAEGSGEGSGKVQPGSAGWSSSGASTTTPQVGWALAIAGLVGAMTALTLTPLARALEELDVL